MGDNNKSKIQIKISNPFKKKEVKDDTNPKDGMDPKTRFEKPGWMDSVGKWGKDKSESLVDNVVKIGKKTGNKFKELTKSAKVISEKLANGEKVTMSEVLTAATEMGMIVSTGGASAFTPELSDAIFNQLIKSEIIDEGTGDNVKQVLKLSSADGLQTALMARAIQAVATDDPTDAEKLKKQIANILASTKKPGVKLSDKTATAKSVADKVTAKNTPKLKSRDGAVEMWRVHIGKKITAVNDYLIKTSKTGYRGLGGALRNEVRDALLQIYLRNTNSIAIYDKTTGQINKMYEIIREYNSGGYHVDGKVTQQEYNKLHLFMKQYLTQNGSLNLPSSSSSSSQELENNSAIQDLGGANYGGPGGLRMETLSGEVIWESLKQSRPHQTGETFFELDLINESEDTIQTLEFSEYMGDVSCAEGSADCTICKEIDKISNVKSAFDWNRTEFQVWFDVDGLEEQRGYEFPIGDISVNPSEVKKVKLRLKKKEDNNIV
jgi:hypothetical protein